MADLSPEVLEERKSILRRFRELLLEQREKFSRYLEIVGHERADIEREDVDALVAHVELERSIVSEIYTFQKAIDPLEVLYREAYPRAVDHDIPEIKSTLETLRDEVVKRNEENRQLLRQRMDLIREEIKSVRNPFAKKRSVYADSDSATVIDIKG